MIVETRNTTIIIIQNAYQLPTATFPTCCQSSTSPTYLFDTESNALHKSSNLKCHRLSTDSLHPKTQLATRGTASNPVQARMEVSHCRYRRDTVSVQLAQLLPVRSKNVDETIHISYDKLLQSVLGPRLPLRLQDRHPSARLVVVPDRMCWLHLLRTEVIPSTPRPSVWEVVDLDRVVVARRSHLPAAAPASV